MTRAVHDEPPPFSFDFGDYGNDIDILCEGSKRLRALLATLRRELPKGRSIPPGMRQNIRRMCNDERIKLRVAIEDRNGQRLPLGEKRCVDYMRYPHYCLTQDYHALNDAKHTAGVDPRVICTASRVISDAQKVGIPLWISEVDPDKAPDAVAIGHCKMRELPWECWDVLDDWVRSGSEATGYHLIRMSRYPGEYRLVDNAPAWSPDAASLKPVRLVGAQRLDEQDRLLTYYAGGSWVDDDGVIHDEETSS